MLHVVWSVDHWLVQVFVILFRLDVDKAAFHLSLDDIHDVTDDLRSVLQVFLIGHLFLFDGISTSKLWIWCSISEWSVELVRSLRLELALNIIELLSALKVGRHVVEICNLVTKFV